MIWWFYRQLKDYKRTPSPQRAAELSARFDRIFKRRTRYATLDRLLKRLLGRKDELSQALDSARMAAIPRRASRLRRPPSRLETRRSRATGEFVIADGSRDSEALVPACERSPRISAKKALSAVACASVVA